MECGNIYIILTKLYIYHRPGRLKWTPLNKLFSYLDLYRCSYLSQSVEFVDTRWSQPQWDGWCATMHLINPTDPLNKPLAGYTGQNSHSLGDFCLATPPQYSFIPLQSPWTAMETLVLYPRPPQTPNILAQYGRKVRGRGWEKGDKIIASVLAVKRAKG